MAKRTERRENLATEIISMAKGSYGGAGLHLLSHWPGM